LLIKALEYWAEISSAYLKNDLSLPEEDAKIVEWLIEKTDQDFNKDEAFSKREYIITKLREWIKGDAKSDFNLKNVLAEREFDGKPWLRFNKDFWKEFDSKKTILEKEAINIKEIGITNEMSGDEKIRAEVLNDKSGIKGLIENFMKLRGDYREKEKISPEEKKKIFDLMSFIHQEIENHNSRIDSFKTEHNIKK
jgi:hypothetical protein